MSPSVEDLVNEVPNPPDDLMISGRRDLETVRQWVDWILAGIDRLNDRFHLDRKASPFLRELVLQNAFLACIYAWQGEAETGKISLVHAWLENSVSTGLHDELFPSMRSYWADLPSKPKVDLTSGDSELLAIFNTAVGERLREDGAAWQGRQVLRDLMTRLGLTSEEVAAMFDVSVETLKDWESGDKIIPAEKLPGVLAGGNALSKLMGVFRPERIADVIRRPAELFDGQSAASWMISGRIAEVAERYDSALTYQG